MKLDNARNSLEYLETSLENEKITEKDLEIARLRVANVGNEIEKNRRDLELAVVYAPCPGP